MKGIILVKGSPFYWFRYYDKLEINPQKRAKKHNTKISATAQDIKRWQNKKPGEKVKLVGTPEVRETLRKLKQALSERRFEDESGGIIKHPVTLSQGFEEFKKVRTVPGSKGELKPKTIIGYKLAVDLMKEACSDKYIYKYTGKEDYAALLRFFETRKFAGRKTKDADGNISSIEYKTMQRNTRSIYTRSLRSLWAFFVKQEYTGSNIIEPVEAEDKDPNPINLVDLGTILDYFKNDTDYPHHYWFIYFMTLTACRPSSAIMCRKEDIDFGLKQITIPNIKTGKRKKKPFYRFPLYAELERLLVEMSITQGDTGRLFEQFAVVEDNYTWPLNFWDRAIAKLREKGKISKPYTLKQIRPTFISFLVNALKMDIYTVYKLADHADIKVTDKSYVDFRLNSARKILDAVTYESIVTYTE